MGFNWNKLLSDDRRRPTHKISGDKRSEFERDYDRLIFSSSLRRLQDKTQVFPLERHDFIRTRLTHSLEVSTLGRSFGVDVVRTLSKKNDELTSKEPEIAAILSTVCLAHDIGNPPFGHFGESAIRSWFEKHFKTHGNKYTLTESQRQDFLHFEGNAQGFRILVYLQCLDDQYGLNLTFGTLASFHKYTASSMDVTSTGGKSKRKIGYYTSEEAVFHQVQEKTGLNGVRHPLAFLMEAADDIAYSTVDLEDGLKKRVVNFDTILEALKERLNKSDYAKNIETLTREKRDLLKNRWSRHEADQITCAKLRIWAIGVMFRACVDAFIQNYDSIMTGRFDDALIEKSNAAELQSVLRSIAQEHVYRSQIVAMQEVIGAKIIHGLLDYFVPAVTSNQRSDPDTLDGKMFKLISTSLRDLNRIVGNNLSNHYDQLQLATDFICGMTDDYALNLYRRLEGHEL